MKNKLQVYRYRKFLRIRGYPYIYIDPTIGRRDYFSSQYRHVISIAFYRKIKGKEVCHSIDREVYDAYIDALKYIEEYPEKVKEMIERLYKKTKELVNESSQTIKSDSIKVL